MPLHRPPSLEIRSPHGVIEVSYKARSWNGITVYCVTQSTAPGKSWQNLTTEQATVAVVLEQLDGIFEPRKRLDAPTVRHRYDAGHTMYIPPNVDIWGYGDSTSLVRDVRMRFDISAVEQLLEDECDQRAWNEPILLLYDERLRQIAELIWTACEDEQESTSLYGESLTTALLVGLFASSRAQARIYPSSLGRLRLKRVLEYMDANLVSDLRLQELASVAGLSASQFGRAFKASTGLSPHRWIIERRIQLAQRLIKDTGKSISIAAHLAGFANQSHFTKAFRTITGTTPRSWMCELNPRGD